MMESPVTYAMGWKSEMVGLRARVHCWCLSIVLRQTALADLVSSTDQVDLEHSKCSR